MPQLNSEFLNNVLNNKYFYDSINGVDPAFCEAIKREWNSLDRGKALNSNKFGPLLSLLHEMFSVICAKYTVIEFENLPSDLSEIIKNIINMNESSESKLKIAFFEGESWSPTYKFTTSLNATDIANKQQSISIVDEKDFLQHTIDQYTAKLNGALKYFNKQTVETRKVLANLAIRDRGRSERTPKGEKRPPRPHSQILLEKNKLNTESPTQSELGNQLSKYEQARMFYVDIHEKLRIAEERVSALSHSSAEITPNIHELKKVVSHSA